MDKPNSKPFPVVLSLLLGLLGPSLQAADFVVDNPLDLVDVAPGDGLCDAGPAVPGQPCTLRAAIMEAEANGEADRILISEGLSIQLGLAGAGGAELGDLNINTEIEIAGYLGEPPGNPALLPLIDATGLGDRHFAILNGQLSLRGLRLQGGSTGTEGGSIFIAGSDNSRLSIEHSVFQFNSAGSRGGAIHIGGLATVTIVDSQFFRNDGGGAGAGAISAQSSSQVRIERSSFLDHRSDIGLFPQLASTISVLGQAQLSLLDSTLDGTLLRPPIPDLAANSGIVVFSEASLTVRNATISNFAESAIVLHNLEGQTRVRIGNSVLQSGVSACRVSGADPGAVDVSIAFSLIEHQDGCQPYYLESVRSGVAELALLTDDPPPRLTFSRPPAGPLSNVVDRGWSVDETSIEADLRCTSSDQRQNPRPLDGNLDGEARCDLGAVEEAPPEAFVVNHFVDDLTDDLPGDGVCATVDQPGLGPVCTLRAAVMEANALPGLQFVTFEPSETPVVLSLPVVGPIGGPLSITDALAIEGRLSEGRPATWIEGQMVGERLFVIQAGGHAIHLRNLGMSGGDASGQVGGAIVVANGEVNLRRCELVGNYAGSGGGALAVIGGSMNVSECDFDGNQTDNAGAAAFSNSGLLSIHQSSFRNHLGLRVDGSAIPVIQLLPDVRAFISNATFSGNQLAIEADQPDLLFLHQLTLADQLSGGLVIDLLLGNELILSNSIIASPDSEVADCLISGVALADTQIGQLLDSDGSCVTLADQGLTADPRLLPLDRPAGRISLQRAPSLTAGAVSPAIDRAAIESCSGWTDQYGRLRPRDLPEQADIEGPCDLGAIEVIGDAMFSDRFELK